MVLMFHEILNQGSPHLHFQNEETEAVRGVVLVFQMVYRFFS